MDQGVSAAAVAIIAVLAICFVALVMLVVSLPGVKRVFQRPQTNRGTHGPEDAHSHVPGLRP
jgi:hypothetical protein